MNIDREVNSGIAKASTASRRLHEIVWERRGIPLSAKVKVYRAAVLSFVLYMPVRHGQCMKVTQKCSICLRKLLKITWHDKVPDTEVLSQTGLPSIYSTLCSREPKSGGLATFSECPTHTSAKDCSMVNLQRGNTHKVDRRSITKIVSKRH